MVSWESNSDEPPIPVGARVENKRTGATGTVTAWFEDGQVTVERDDKKWEHRDADTYKILDEST